MATREYYDFMLGKRKILLSFHKSLLFLPPLLPLPSFVFFLFLHPLVITL